MSKKGLYLYESNSDSFIDDIAYDYDFTDKLKNVLGYIEYVLNYDVREDEDIEYILNQIEELKELL